MMNRILLLLSVVATLSGCGIGGYWMNGNPTAGQNVKPYGAHWVKDGMTRESRRGDSLACGAKQTDLGAITPMFADEIIQSRRLPSDPNNTYKAEERLRMQWAICMRERSYSYAEKCDSNCMYP